MPDRIPPTYDTFDALTIGEDGAPEFLKAQPMSDKPGFDGYLVPWYTLSDRGSYFVPGAFKKTATERLKKAPHLWSHNMWQDLVPPGHHSAAIEDDKGFRISVLINEGIKEGADIMSALRFGSPLGLSVGFDGIRDRTGTEEDDAKLDRRTAPDYWKNVPITELRAITEARWWESSSVVFGAIATAKPDEVRSRAADTLQSLLSAITAGTLTPEQVIQAEAFVTAWQTRAAAGSTTAPAPSHVGRDFDREFAHLFGDLSDLLGEAA